MEKVKVGIRSWLDVQSANPTKINITESLDYEGNAIKNRIWYRGDSNELEQLYDYNKRVISERDSVYRRWSFQGHI